MKSKIFKKVIALFLAAVFVAIVPFSAMAEEPLKTPERDCPEIYVPGIMASDIYADADDPENDELIWPMPTDNILNMVKQLLKPLAELAVTKDWDKFSGVLVPLFDELFADICLDYSGEASNGSGARFEYPEADSIEKDSCITFNYDWRLDPLVSAAELNDFVDYVLEASGSDHVTIHCHSLGGIVTLSYLKVYGNSKVRGVMFDSTAIFGETYTGELLQGKLEVKEEALLYYLDFAFDQNDAELLLDFIMESLSEAGLMEFVINFADKFIENVYDDAVYSLLKVFANWPTIWAMVPDEMLADCQTYVFDSLYKSAEFDYSKLVEKVEGYNTTVRAGKAEALKSLQNGTDIYVLSRYGYSSLPITPGWSSLGDGVVDTKYNSFGATTTAYGSTLEVEEGPFISPDKTVDASTCLFPEHTWFVKSLKHSDGGSAVDRVAEKLLYSGCYVDVDTFDEYPRFVEYDADSDSIAPEKAPTAFEIFIANLLSFIKKIIFALFIF